MSTKPRLLFYCQHSLGMGHFVRARALAEALSERFELVLVTGGAESGHAAVASAFRTVQLPALRMDSAHRLVAGSAGADIDGIKDRRREMLLALADQFQPDVILIELYPFGRKKFEFELLPLLERSSPVSASRPRVFCSVRDILVRGRNDQQAHDDRACRVLNRWFDAVLVHADPALVRLEDTFQPTTPVEVPLLYTGFVTPRRPNAVDGRRRSHIVVSAGGGAVGGPLYRAAIAARRMQSAFERLPMTIVAGPFLPEGEWQALQRNGADMHDLTMLRSVPDLFPMLQGAEFAICQSGYNTSLEVIGSGVRALMVPFLEAGEDEQLNRARQLEALGVVRVLDPTSLSAASLAAAIRELRRFAPRPTAIDFSGASRTVDLIEACLPRQIVARASAPGQRAGGRRA